ncbi:MAG: hypothetical protein M3007_06305, partial [Candidatus Eremiobacteraeota bacterium]|nr:hypothetical protein [Candidatus Eremiobacteraeota bacterium]
MPVGKDATRPGLPNASLVPDIWAFASSAVMMLPRTARKGAACEGRNLLGHMSKGNYVAASFPLMGYATGAIDWFRNQAIDPDAIVVAAVPPGGQPRAPQRGDNARSDLRWIVALDLDAAR